jgi:uncharacterized protein (DUF58 family)
MIGALLDRHPRFASWLYGFKPPERGTVVLVHRRVYIVPTRLGWTFGATLLLLLVGSINYALSLGFALTFLLAGMGLVAMVHTARNLARVALSAGRSEPVFAGESAQFRLHLAGRAPFDRPAILVRHVASGAQTVLDIPAHGQAEALLAVPATRRGWLPLGRVMLETRFPSGLFRAWSYTEPEARCLVYPRPERTALPAPIAHAAQGALRTASAGNDDFATLRGYQLSDSPRHVAWKAFARTDELLTKQFSGEGAAQLWLDWQLLPAGLVIEQRLARLAGWVLQAERSGAHYGLRLPGVELAAARGEAHAASCLQALALFDEPREEARP